MSQESKHYEEKPVDKCTECGSINLIHNYDTSETVCRDCGLVQPYEEMDKRPEWRAFTQEEKASRSRIGPPTTYTIHDKGLSTAISQIDRDAYGRKLPLSTRYEMWRLRKQQIRARVYRSIDKNLVRGMNELDRLSGSNQLNIPKPVQEKAAVIYRKAAKKRLTRGRSIAAIVAAALYAACRQTGTPRSLREIAEVSLIEKKDVARFYRLLLRELDIQVSIPKPLTYVSKIANLLKISGETAGIAAKIIREAKKKRRTSGKGPTGLAAAALYIACVLTEERRTQKDVAEAADVTEVTVRNRYKTLMEELDITVKLHPEPHE